MATLVLTVVGGAIGGPIGAAVGAVIGQQADRALFAPPGRRGPRLTELAVQTSSYGTPIPRLYGRLRVAGTVIWATDLIETRSRSRGGKGQPSVTTYSYAASFAVALSTRAIQGVGRIWADGKLLRGAAGDWKTSTGFRLHRGGEAQVPDPLIASAVTAAPAHRGIAYAVFENLQLADFGNRIPSLTFEVIADAASPRTGAIARDVGAPVVTGEGPAATVGGFAASGDAGGVLDLLATLSGGWFGPVAGGVVLADQMGSPVAIDGEPRVTQRRRTRDGAPVRLAVQHYDAARDFQTGVQQASVEGAGWREELVELPTVLSAGEARGIAERLLAARDRDRIRVELRSDARALAIVPGAAVTTTALPGAWRVTDVALEAMEVTLTLAPPVTAVPARVSDGGQAASAPDHAAGATRIEAFELPPLDDTLPQVPQLAVAAAGTLPGWRRAALMTSVDAGASWSAAQATAEPARMGMLASEMPWAPATLQDRSSVVEVELLHDAMTLEGATGAAIDRGANLALVGDELIQFAAAVQLAPRRWRIATLLRGRRGTRASAHAAGTRFVLIERDALAFVTPPGVRAGDTVRVLASGVGDADPVSVELALVGASIAPPAPVHVHAHQSASGAITVTWRRRSRSGWRWSDGGDVPLGEEQERYRVRASDALGARTFLVDAPACTIPWDGHVGLLSIAVSQLGTLAASHETSITIDRG